jgi:hypothetical protein
MVPSPPEIQPPPNGSVSWNVTYAGMEEGNNGAVANYDCHSGSNCNNQRDYHQQHQGQGHQKRNRDGNNDGDYNAEGRREYYGGGRDGRDYR